ncbi:hypothetical protein VE00_08422 [Pseudogymnoascus sp. WSF 3629]|nr:hypothetical protein VE00_08422 [Pseudogymnoascus sp. WSF 3629]
MQLLALLAAATGAAAVAMPNAGGVPSGLGNGQSKGWGLKKFKNLVSFGDSYTDESRLGYFQQHNGQGPPAGTLLPGSTSTPGGGITWPRWVSIYSGASLFNYAVSGAVCSNKMIYRYLDSISGPFPDVLGYEVPAYQADAAYINKTTRTNTLFTDRKSDNTVYSMWIGTNDLGNDALITDSTLHGETISDYIDCIFEAFDGIYKTGGRYFVLMNVAPLDLSPLYGLPSAGGLASSHYWPNKPANTTEQSGKMKEYSSTVNSVLEYRVPFEVKLANRYPGAHFAIFDTHRLITDIYNNPTTYLNGTGTLHVNEPYQVCPPAGGNCVNSKESLDNFLWFDELHPSERTDQVIATHFLDVVKGTSKFATYW